MLSDGTVVYNITGRRDTIEWRYYGGGAGKTIMVTRILAAPHKVGLPFFIQLNSKAQLVYNLTISVNRNILQVKYVVATSSLTGVLA